MEAVVTNRNELVPSMYRGQKVVVVLPAYNAARTLHDTVREIPFDVVDELVLVDDDSKDNTIDVAHQLGIKHIIRHEKNKGYGANQKTCYNTALELGADVIVMLHPDYQYTPLLLHAMISMIGNGVYPVVFGSRILGKGARRGGMPLYKYFSNRILTFIQNVLLNQHLSEYHTGYRAFSREVLQRVNYAANADGFIFDNEIVAQIFHCGYEIAEITCPTKYFPEASSIRFLQSMKYGLGVLRVSLLYFLNKTGVFQWKRLTNRSA